MRPRALALSLAGCAAVLVGGGEIGQSILQPAAQAAAAAADPTSSSSSSAASSATTSSASASASATPSATPTATASGVSGTFVGTTEQTRYGPMQVEIVVRRSRITDVKALQLTNQDPRSVQISESAAPVLRQEALSAQSAKIDTVSGATYTCEGYLSSLQSAIDKANL
ncbi:FMN-binding protein [Amnibacterium sp.]|uniref:FMN-binding protein n=1 Tax=Amnibacterium sp. TaxID=1872496 RepID=UPI0026263638|nr:FMN-binding protein [Amnibacterium sp.]MCU1473285.1 FMN-binding protein [Amnibacterium sp.]